jgi:hypothetical protein
MNISDQEFNQLLERIKKDKATPQERLEMLKGINEAVRRLQKLAEDILKIAKQKQ